MQTLIEHSRSAQDSLLNIYGIGQPGINHKLFAALLAADLLKIVITTNFDMLIEQAYEQHCKKTNDLQVYYQETHFTKCDLDDDQKKLIKTHGSYHNKTSMIISIKQIASRENSIHRKRLIEKIFSNDRRNNEDQSMLILGYSCSDVFDINESISTLFDVKRIIYLVQHDTTQEQVENIEVCKEKNPFNRYQGLRIYCDTNKFVEKLWQNLLQQPYEEDKQLIALPQWQPMINEWIDINSDYKKHEILGALTFTVGDFAKSMSYYKKLLTLIDDNVEQSTKAWCLHNIGLACNAYEDSVRAIDYFKQALKIAKRNKDRELLMLLYGNLAVAHMKLSFLRDPRNQIPMRYYKKALRQARLLKDKYHEGVWHSGIATIYLKNKEDTLALPELQKLLAVAQQYGDKRSELLRLANLGSVHYHLGNYEDSIWFYNKAEHIARALGDINIVAELHENIKKAGEKHEEPDRFDKAMQRMGIEILDETQIKERRFYSLQIFIVTVVIIVIIWFKNSC
ncbi:MAG: tetratricopeptide repeat protein [Deltaproteobacteria bacterium]|nr:tetratricopeptide repeat protein [Deltaproteobacteria bacterium]